MSIHSLTLPIILNIIYVILNMVFNIEISYFRTMYTSIAYIYLIASILIMKSDMIKRHQVISKIIEVQNKVKEETEKGLEENKDESKNKNKDTNNKENKDSENDDTNVGEPTEDNLEGDM